MENSKKKLWAGIGIACAVLLFISTIGYFLFLADFSKKPNDVSLFIDNDDNIDSILCKVDTTANTYPLEGFKLLAHFGKYNERIRTGHYVIPTGISSLDLFRNLKNGHQTPIKLVVPSVRTRERLAEELGKRLMFGCNELLNALKDSAACASIGYDTATILCNFIPNTYEIYWNIGVSKFMERMKKEHENFWTNERKEKAMAAGLTPNEVSILASIIDEETANNGEKPDVAGMYINRLNRDMLLQADPTVKYAMQAFKLRRIYNNMLQIDNPYNTYKYLGLPPGPIRIPSVAGIEAVLNHSHHDYLYMCAKEDFSGTHNFARTFQEHIQNARRYAKALNERGIH